jgi:hypothetical protein
VEWLGAKKQEFAMLQRLLVRWRIWEQALAGMDDPRGEYLFSWEEQLHRLEGEVEHLRRPLSTGAVAAVSPANAPQTE